MKKWIYITIMLVCSAALSACNSDTGINMAVDGVTVSDTMDFSDVNSMLTTLPMFKDENGIYYAEEGKELKKKNGDNETILYACEDSEMIRDIYADDNFIYYAKERAMQNEIVISSVNKTDLNDKQDLLTLPCHSTGSDGDNFVYADDGVYYFDIKDRMLYYNGLQTIENVTGAVICDRIIYYADGSAIYSCKKDLSGSRLLWSKESMPENNDDSTFARKYTSILQSELPEIRNLSVIGDRIYFTVSETFARNGILTSIKIDGSETSYENDLWVYRYQIDNGNIYFSTMYSDSVKMFRLNEMPEPIDLAKVYFYICDSDCYYYDNERYGIGLSKIDLAE